MAPSRGGGGRKRTGVELGAVRGEGALVVNLDAVALLRPAITFDFLGDVYLKVRRGLSEGADGGEGEEQDVLHRGGVEGRRRRFWGRRCADRCLLCGGGDQGCMSLFRMLVVNSH